MDKNLINEISRIHQVMGVEIINEIAAGGLSNILKTAIKSFAENEKNLIKSFIEGTLDSASKSELINILKSEDGDALMTNLKTLINRSTVAAEKMLAQKELKLIEDLIKSGGKKISSQIEMTIKRMKTQIGNDPKFALIFSQATDSVRARKVVEDFMENGIKLGKSYQQMADDAFKLAKNQPGVKQAQREALDEMWNTWKKRAVNNKKLLMVGAAIFLLWGNGLIKDFSILTNSFKKLLKQIGIESSPQNTGGGSSKGQGGADKI